MSRYLPLLQINMSWVLSSQRGLIVLWYFFGHAALYTFSHEYYS